MKITPLEIRQKTFEKNFRGYDKEEVTAFLLSVSNEWERMMDEQKELRIKLEQSEKEVQKLREVESSLFKTLKTAEDTGANMIDQATKAAELHLKETQMNAEAMLNEAKSKAKSIIEKAEMQSRDIIEEMQSAIKDMEQNYRAIENYQENLVMELSNLSDDINTKVSKLNVKSQKFTLEDHLKRVKKVVRESQQMIEDEPLELRPVRKPKMPELTRPTEELEPPKEVVEKKAAKPEPEKKKQPQAAKATPKPQPVKETETNEGESFFDQLDD